MDGLWRAMAVSLQTDMNHVNAAAQNMANVSTMGFKRMVPLAATGETTSAGVDQRQGALMATGAELDVALEGHGYFVVLDQGKPLLTRGGALRVDPSGRLLHAQSGLPLQSERGEVVVRPGALRIDPSGDVWQHGDKLARLRLAQPARQARLEAAGSALYQLKGSMEEAAAMARQPLVRQGHLEMSNVNSTQEMVRLMEALRHFESVQKALHGLDAIWDKAVRTLGEF